MQVEIRCLSCKGVYVCRQGNTKIFGPIIDTTCPLCGNFVSKNYSAFVRDQTDDIEENFAQAGAMIRLAQAISKIISNEESFKKKK